MHISNQNLLEMLQSYVLKIAKRLCLLVFSEVKNRNCIASAYGRHNIRGAAPRIVFESSGSSRNNQTK